MLKTALLVFSMAACVAPAQYFPLHPGDQWIYRLEEGPGKDVRTAEVSGTETADGSEYLIYRNFMGETARIQLTPEEKVVQWTPEGGARLWWDFNAAEGVTFPTSFDRCTGRGTIVSRSEQAELMGRDWKNGIRIRYAPTSCADAGVLEDLFFPGLGLAERTYQSFSGPRKYRLTYARIGNASIISGGEYSFRINLNEKKHSPRASIELRLTLENRTKEPLLLRFSSGQSYDFLIRDNSGRVVYQWSADKLFPAQYREEPVQGERNWTVSQEVELKPQEYLLEAWLTTVDKPVFRAQVPITVDASATPKNTP